MPASPSRLRLLGVLAPCVVLLAGADYRGCDATAPVASGPLELSAATGCVLDADCVSEDVCANLACRGGTCVERDRGRDGDGDGFAAVPCGEDCDDGDAEVHPEATERCDGSDQDCDATVDEGAVGTVLREVSDSLAASTMVASGSAFVVVGESVDTPGLSAYRIDGDAIGVRQRVTTEPLGLFAATGREDGSILVVHVASELAPPTTLELEPDGAVFRLIGTPRTFDVVGRVTALTAARFAAQDWVVVDSTDETGAPHRALFRSGAAEPVPLAPDPFGEPPDLADDGAALAVTDGPDTVRFVGEDGSTLAQRILPGRFAGAPLASGDGDVVAAYRDAFDYALTRVTRDGNSSPVAAPLGDRSDAVFLFTIDGDVLVARVDALRLSGWLLDPTLRRYVATFPPGALSAIGGSPLSATSATTTDGRTALHLGYPGASAITHFACEAP